MPVNMVGYTLRPAEAQDFPAIRKLIRRVGINPLGLHWERFILAVDEDRSMIGCGQVKQHGDGSHELASIAVVEAWRGQGAASAIIRRLMQGENGPLFLTCRTSLGPFYQRFGFREAKAGELPPYFRHLSRLAVSLRSLRLMPAEGLLIMLWERQSGTTFS
jgi:N-acetylglutamate synthase-like GNAT family acetyltransferase